MLFRTVFLPSILEISPESPNKKLLFEAANRLLFDLTENCIVLVDTEDIFFNSGNYYLEKWPIKFKQKAQVLWKYLKKNRRFIKASLKYSSNLICEKDFCPNLIGIAETESPVCVLANQACIKCIMNQFSSPKFEPVDVDLYSFSKFHDSRRKMLSFNLEDGEWNKNKFEEEILIPLFQDAKNIKLYDRMIGRCINRNNKEKKLEFPGNYAKTLEWFCQVFIKILKSHHEELSKSHHDRTFEIISSIKSKKSKNSQNKKDQGQDKDKNDKVRKFHEFVEELCKKHDFPFKLIIKEEKFGKQELQHARFLLTDQIDILIDRGFDLLWGNEKMESNGVDFGEEDRNRRIRDVAIAVITNKTERQKIRSSIKNLPDVIP